MLIEKKQSMYAKENRMTQLREIEDRNYKESTTEYLSSDEEDDEENFSWFQDTDPDNYFCLCTRNKNLIQ